MQYAPKQRVSDVTVRGEHYLPGPEVKTTINDWYAQAWETELGEVLFGTSTEIPSEEATITEITDKTEDDTGTTENEVVKTTTVKNSEVDKTSSDNVTSFNPDIDDNPTFWLHRLSKAPLNCLNYRL